MIDDLLEPTADEEREQLLQLLYLCPVAILRLNAYGDIILMNPHGTRLLMPLSISGDCDNLYDLLFPFAPEVREMAMRFPALTGAICEEHRITIAPQEHDPHDAPRILSLTLNKLDRDLLVAVVADVTASARREYLVRSSEERLHAVLDGVKEYAICTVDLHGAITSWNRAAEKLDDYRSDEVMGTLFEMLTPGNGVGRNAFRKHLDTARREGWHEFEAWRVRKDGSRYWAHCTISSLHKADDTMLLGFSIITRDSTERRRVEDHLRRLATTDPLTGALNRRAFFEAAKVEETRCRKSGQSLALLMLDADHFKTINDEHGHETGDVVLQRIVSECRSVIHSSDLLARFGGEEFVILLTGSHGEIDGLAIADKIRTKIASIQPALADKALAVTVSIGVTHATAKDVNVNAMLRAADAALYAAKHQGRNSTVVAHI